MARARTSVGLGRFSGIIGDMVASQGQDGMILRSRWTSHARRTLPQLEHTERLRIVNRLWDDLSREECTAWRAYAVTLSSRNPSTGGLKIPRACGLFVGLGTKYLQIHGGAEPPRLPPEGRFAGDVLSIAAEGEEMALSFVSDGTNRPGVATEILSQPLTGPNNLPKIKSYKSRGFVAFEAGVPVEIPVELSLYWACAFRFVEPATGRMTELLEIGTTMVYRSDG